MNKIILKELVKVKKLSIVMEIAKTHFLTVIYLFSFCISCAQNDSSAAIEKDGYFLFKQQVYRLGKQSLADNSISKLVLEECIFEGFILATIDINKSGKPNYELAYASSELFKNVFFESLKKADISTLNEGKKYLIPISFKGYRSPDFETNCITIDKNLSIPIIGKPSNDIDYVFEPFDFYWTTPIS